MRLGNLPVGGLLTAIADRDCRNPRRLGSGDRSCNLAQIFTLGTELAPAAQQGKERPYDRAAHNHRTNKQQADQCVFPQLGDLHTHFTDRIKHHGGEGHYRQHHCAGEFGRAHRSVALGGGQSFAIPMPK